MTSFAAAIEPAASPRLAAAATLLHGFAAAAPWIARVPAEVAIALTALAALSLASTLAKLPGRHCALAALSVGPRGWQARLAGRKDWQPAVPGPRSRVMPALILIDIRAGERRLGWLLPRGALPECDFRRLKARIRLSC